MGPQRLEGQVIPAQVRTCGAGGQRDIHAIVDQDGNGQDGHERAGQLQDFRRRAIFPADLNHRRAPRDRGATHSHGIPPLEQDGIRDHHQAQLIGKRHDQDPARPAWCDHGDREHK